MADSKIEWTDTTWNPVVGCARVSAGCEHCYAETMAARHVLMSQAQGRKSPYLPVVDVERRRWNRKAVFLPERLGDPLRWRKPRRIFVNSMSDLFHEDITFEQVAAVFGVMAAASQHTFQVLTKRPRRMREFFDWIGAASCPDSDAIQSATMLVPFADLDRFDEGVSRLPTSSIWPLPNVHLGVSVEDQRAADERIPVLLACPAALRFLSVEPLLGPVNLRHVDADRHDYDDMYQVDTLTGRNRDMGRPCRDVNRIGWVIVGGESGPGARACEVGWIRSIVSQCSEAGVPVFVKQLGARPTASSANDIGDAMFAAIEAADMATAEMLRDGCLCELRLRDRKGGNPDEWPEDLRVRQLPGGAP